MLELERQFAAQQTLDPSLTTVVAVSGGADSVALLRLVHAALPDHGILVVAHVNHAWHPHAEQDARFVAALAKQLGMRFELETVATQGATSEEVARQQRYERLVAVAHRCGGRYLLMAHTADDQAETVLFRVLRGAGLRGLTGIPMVRVIDESLTLKRPLLHVSREQLREYLAHLGQSFLDDPSNSDLRYARNRIRHQLLPQIAEMFAGDPKAALCRLSQLASEAMEELRPAIRSCLDEAVAVPREQASLPPARTALASVEVDCRALRQYSPFLIREALAQLWQERGWPAGEMTQSRWLELEALVISDDEATVMLPGGIRVARRGDRMQLAPQSSQ